VDISSKNIEQRLDFWMNEFMTMGTSNHSPAVVNTDGSRTPHSSSIGSSDFHAEQLHLVNSVFFSVVVNKVDKVGKQQTISKEDRIDQLELSLQSWCTNAQQKYNITNSITRHYVSAKTGENVDNAFN